MVSQYNQEFNEKALEVEHGMSVEDKKFEEIMERSACMLKGHYCMDLPFRIT